MGPVSAPGQTPYYGKGISTYASRIDVTEEERAWKVSYSSYLPITSAPTSLAEASHMVISNSEEVEKHNPPMPPGGGAAKIPDGIGH